MDHPESLTLSLHCSSCGRRVDLRYERGDEFRHVAWSCPYASCGRPQEFELKGRVVSVLRAEDSQHS